MRYLFLILVIFSIASGCKINKKGNLKKSNLKEAIPKAIIFGIHCGECRQNCATMYKYLCGERILLVDYSDSYFKSRNRNDSLVFNDTIRDDSALMLCKKLVDSIPKYLYYNNKNFERFGCPDCTDGCGINFMIVQDTCIKQFDIDRFKTYSNKDVELYSHLIEDILNSRVFIRLQPDY